MIFKKTDILVLLLFAPFLAFFTGCSNRFGTGALGPSRYMAVWASDEDGKDSDFLAIIDADPKSGTYGKVLRTATLPEIPGAHLLAVTRFSGAPDDFPSHRLNEAHHMNEKLSPDKKLYTGGLISGNIFKFDLNDPANVTSPELVVRYRDDSRFSAPDDIVVLSNGNLLATYMGAGGKTVPPALTTPGGLVEFSPDGKFIAEYDAVLPNGPAHYRTGEDTGLLANPHGIAVREDLNLLVTSDFADPVSLATSSYNDQHQIFRTTIRVWDLKERKVRKVVQVPDGPRDEKRVNDNEPEGLMMVRLLNGKDRRGAFTASMQGGALYYSPDMTASEPVFRQVYDFGPSAGASVFAITEDDRYLIVPLSGIKAPGDASGYDPEKNARRVVQLDISALVAAGADFKCSGDNLNAPDCPRLASQVNFNSPKNFQTHGGPHIAVLDNGGERIGVVNYFVDLSHGFGLPGTGSCGDHRLHIVKREGADLVIDEGFRDEFDGAPGINFSRLEWPHGETGNAKPHGFLFIE